MFLELGKLVRYNFLMAVAYVLDDVFAEHEPPRDHPERPARVAAVRDALRAAGLEARGARMAVRQAREEEIGTVHSAAHFTELASRLPGRSGWLDPDTYYSPHSFRSALAAVGASVDLARASLAGEHRRGIAVVRPPGHHAESDRAMGFCLFNNVAIAAACALEHGAGRVAVLDFDVHHGNGTQAIFYREPRVLYLSTHQYPFYPGTGAVTEVGAGPGHGTTLNVPLPAGCGDAEYCAAFDQVIVPAIKRFSPDLLLLSAGFDAYIADPLGGMRLSLAGYGELARRAVRVAEQTCEGRVVAVLEGGYDLEGTAGGTVALLCAMEEAERGELPRSDEPKASSKPLVRGAEEAIAAAIAAVAGVQT
jgi:acetoin utilization deacetylase AcuC-like enzyme